MADNMRDIFPDNFIIGTKFLKLHFLIKDEIPQKLILIKYQNSFDFQL